jgi:hypothetical protein
MSLAHFIYMHGRVTTGNSNKPNNKNLVECSKDHPISQLLAAVLSNYDTIMQR